MKKCLHLKKTKPHWRRRPAPVVTWRDRLEAERRERAERQARARMGGAITGAEAAMLAAVLGLK